VQDYLNVEGKEVGNGVARKMFAKGNGNQSVIASLRESFLKLVVRPAKSG
jgi:hypothetical protein